MASIKDEGRCFCRFHDSPASASVGVRFYVNDGPANDSIGGRVEIKSGAKFRDDGGTWGAIELDEVACAPKVISWHLQITEDGIMRNDGSEIVAPNAHLYFSARLTLSGGPILTDGILEVGDSDDPKAARMPLGKIELTPLSLMASN